MDFQRQLNIGRLTESITEGVNQDLLNLVRRGAAPQDILAELTTNTPEQITAFARAAGVRDTAQFVRVVEELGAPLRRTRELFNRLNLAVDDSVLALNEEFNDALSRLSATLTATFAEVILGGFNTEGQSSEEIANRLDMIIEEIQKGFRRTLEVVYLVVSAIVSLGRTISIPAILDGLFFSVILPSLAPFLLLFGRRFVPTLDRRRAQRLCQERDGVPASGVFQGTVRGVPSARDVTASVQRIQEIARFARDIFVFEAAAVYTIRYLIRLRDFYFRISDAFKGFTTFIARQLGTLLAFIGRTLPNLSKFLVTAGTFLTRVGTTPIRVLGLLLIGIGRFVQFIQRQRLAGRIVAWFGISQLFNRLVIDIGDLITSVFGAIERLIGYLTPIGNVARGLRDGVRRVISPDENDNRSAAERLNSARTSRANFLSTFNAQFVTAERTAADWATTVSGAASTIARTLNDTINEMVRGIADGTANMRAIWRNFLNTFIKTLQDALVLKPLEDGIQRIAGVVGRGLLDVAGVVPSGTRPLDYIDRITPGLGEFGVGVTPTSAGSSGVVVNQEFNFNRGVDAADAADIALQASQAVQADFLVKVGRAGTPESRAIKGY